MQVYLPYGKSLQVLTLQILLEPWNNKSSIFAFLTIRCAYKGYKLLSKTQKREIISYVIGIGKENDVIISYRTCWKLYIYCASIVIILLAVAAFRSISISYVLNLLVLFSLWRSDVHACALGMSLTELMLCEITLTLFINAIECVYKRVKSGEGDVLLLPLSHYCLSM